MNKRLYEIIISFIILIISLLTFGLLVCLNDFIEIEDIAVFIIGGIILLDLLFLK